MAEPVSKAKPVADKAAPGKPAAGKPSADKKTEAGKSKSPSLSDVFDETEIVEEPRTRRSKRIQVDLKCPFCESGVDSVTYKDVYQLKKYTSVRGKIIGRDKSGMCFKHQRQLSSAIKKARYMALLPYVSITR